MGHELGQLLGEISEDEKIQGRPMLSALAVSATTGRPSSHFYNYTRDLGKLKSVNNPDEIAFWKSECKALYETWKVSVREKKSE
jgi:hypothetical protein